MAETTTTRWWWIRHAPVNSNGCIYGQLDWPADCSDRPCFEALAALLPGEAVWLTSHLRRTRQTAEALIEFHDPPGEMIAEPELAEQHFGSWQGRPREAVVREQGEAWNRFWLAPAHERAPEGESFTDLMARTKTAVERLSRTHAGRDIVAVTHGGTIRAALALALGLEPERALSFVIDNCSLTRLDHIAGPFGTAWRVALVNHPAQARVG